MKTGTKLLCVITCVLIMFPAGNSQTDSCERTVVVTVFQKGSARGPAAITDLRADDLNVKSSGKVSVQAAIFHSGPRRLMLVIDIGAGSQTRAEWNAALAISSNLIEGMPVGSELGLVTFSDKVEQKVPPTADRGGMRDTVRSLTPVSRKSSEEALLDALDEGLGLLGPAATGNVEVFISNTSAKKGSKLPKGSTLLPRLLDSNIRIFGIGFGGPMIQIQAGEPRVGTTIPLATTVENYPGLFSAAERIAVVTGGTPLNFRADSGDMPKSAKTVAEFITAMATNYYALTFNGPEVKKTEPLAVRLKDKKAAGASFLLHPTALYPCSHP